MPARLRAASVLAVIALLVVSGLAVGLPLADAATPSPTPTPTPGADGPNGSDQETPTFRSINTTMRIDVRPSGDARWTVTMTTTLANGSDRSEFEQIASEFEAGELSVLPVRSFRAASQQVSAATGREMGIDSVNRTSAVGETTGSLVLRFTWTNFGEKRGERLYVQDVFNGTQGRWFPSLADSQTLVLTIPAGYDLSSASRGATLRNQTLRWQGPVQFGPGTPYVVYVESTPPPTRTATPTTTPPTTTPGTTIGPGDDATGDGMVVPVLVLTLLGALAVLGYVVTRSDGSVVPDAGDDSDDSGDDHSGDTPAAAMPGSAPESEDPAEEVEEGGPDDEVDEELLSDEERVERLIERNGGRMKQANIVSETGWSNAKVSQLLSSMDEAGRIEKLRIGRENLISFPDEDVGGDDEP